jgi:hypothetical protein
LVEHEINLNYGFVLAFKYQEHIFEFEVDDADGAVG